MSLASLFAAGAHRSIESLFAFGRATLANAEEALMTRFGPLSAEDLRELPYLYQQVRQAIIAGRTLTAGLPIEAGEFGENIALPSGYSYTVIARVNSPTDPTNDAEIPWTIRSEVPLSPDEIQARATTELLNFQGERYRPAAGENTDLIRRDYRVRQNIANWGDDAANEIAITVLSAYRS